MKYQNPAKYLKTDQREVEFKVLMTLNPLNYIVIQQSDTIANQFYVESGLVLREVLLDGSATEHT